MKKLQVKRLQINLGKETEARWREVENQPEFKYTNQQGIFDALCVAYLNTKGVTVPIVHED